jgi:hypothetical protein
MFKKLVTTVLVVMFSFVSSQLPAIRSQKTNGLHNKHLDLGRRSSGERRLRPAGKIRSVSSLSRIATVQEVVQGKLHLHRLSHGQVLKPFSGRRVRITGNLILDRTRRPQEKERQFVASYLGETDRLQ